jgi:CelD/BcsL family acetyltransferase involved in cellulose biosynthesis
MNGRSRLRAGRRHIRSNSRSVGEPQILTTASFEELAGEWDDLALRTSAPPFARPGWISAWWSAFGRGEPRVFALRRNRELTAVLPLSRFRGRLEACSNVHTPVLRRLDSEGKLAAAARRLGSEGQLRLARLEAMASPYVDPTITWEQFEQSLSNSRRKELSRRRRRLADKGEIEIEASDGSVELEAELSEFLRLEGSGWKEQKGTAVHLRPETQRFYEDAADWAAGMGLLRLTFLRVGDRRVAAQYMIDDGAQRHLLKIGYDPAYSRFGPGVILELDDVRAALADGRTFELGTGMNAIKEEFMNAQRTIEHLALFPRSRRGALARRSVTARQAFYRRARGSALVRRARDILRRFERRGRASVRTTSSAGLQGPAT